MNTTFHRAPCCGAPFFRAPSPQSPAPTTPPTIPADTIRLARVADAPAVAELIERSCLALASGDEDRSGFRSLFDVGLSSQDQPIRDGTSYVAESAGQSIGVCAWGPTAPAPESGFDSAGNGAGHRYSDSSGQVRALAIDPDYPPLALARLLLLLCESAAARQGFNSLEAVVIRPRRWLYLACGFRAVGALKVRCPNGAALPGLLVRKPIVLAHPLLNRVMKPSPRRSARRAYRTLTRHL
jgi:GNAT superfamily N-acetyltransferase